MLFLFSQSLNSFTLDSLKYIKIYNLFYTDDSCFKEFFYFRENLTNVIYKHFTLNQIKGINSIKLINHFCILPDSFVVGADWHFGKKSNIEIAVYCLNIQEVLFHEIFHSIYFKYYKYFRKNKSKWLKINQFVSEYARKNIKEDFAETGSHYLKGDTLYKNEKFKIITKILKKIK